MAINGYLAALNPVNGDEIWRTDLAHRGTSGAVSALVLKGQLLFVGYHGHVYCLNRETGEILWENRLKGMGYHSVMLTMAGADNTSDAAAQTAAEETRAAAAATAAAALSAHG